MSAVAASPHGLTAREIADAVGLKIATAYHLIHTLVGEGFLVSGGARRYRLGFRVGTLVDGFERQVVPGDLVPFAQALALRTGETAYVSVRRKAELATVCSVPGAHAVSVLRSPLGPINNAHSRASGKLLLALAPPDIRDAYLAAHPMTPCTPHTIVDRAALEAELETIRRQGYAVDHEESLPGVCCLSVPLAQEPVVALSISAPSRRYEESFATYLDAARQIASGPLPESDGLTGRDQNEAHVID
jgi:DNA-binding IclR family transcriptional regulator